MTAPTPHSHAPSQRDYAAPASSSNCRGGTHQHDEVDNVLSLFDVFTGCPFLGHRDHASDRHARVHAGGEAPAVGQPRPVAPLADRRPAEACVGEDQGAQARAASRARVTLSSGWEPGTRARRGLRASSLLDCPGGAAAAGGFSPLSGGVTFFAYPCQFRLVRLGSDPSRLPSAARSSQGGRGCQCLQRLCHAERTGREPRARPAVTGRRDGCFLAGSRPSHDPNRRDVTRRDADQSLTVGRDRHASLATPSGLLTGPRDSAQASSRGAASSWAGSQPVAVDAVPDLAESCGLKEAGGGAPAASFTIRRGCRISSPRLGAVHASYCSPSRSLSARLATGRGAMPRQLSGAV